MFRRLAQLVRPGYPVNVVSPAPKTAAMPAEQNSIGSNDPMTKGVRSSPTSAASIGRGTEQPLQPAPMDPFCVMAADTPHGIFPCYLNRNRPVVTHVS
jgi:hypothetical protein